MSSLFYGTVTNLLKDSLITLMESSALTKFRLVGGTSLSLQIGHRISVDIDLFTDAPYGSIDLKEIDDFIENTFPFHVHSSGIDPAMGKSYSIGTDNDNTVKLDVFYTDTFIQPALVVEGIRLATIEEIIAMKVDVVQRVGRKKDFWDLHELLTNHDIQAMIALHQRRYPYTHDKDLILKHNEMESRINMSGYATITSGNGDYTIQHYIRSTSSLDYIPNGHLD